MSRIGVDLDGVVYEYAAPFMDFVRKELKDPSLPYPSTWYFYREEWPMPITDQEFLDLMQKAVTAGAIFRHGAAVSGAVSALRLLKEEGHEIHIVTHRSQIGAERATRLWLEENGVPYTSLTFSADKTVVDGLDLFIDDRPKNVKAIIEAGVKAVYFDQPWNQGEPEDRVYSWAEFVALVVKGWPCDPQEPVIGEVRVVDPTTGGAKGQKQARFDLLPWDVINLDALLYGKGAEKYEDRNWERGYAYGLSVGALGRHLTAYLTGEFYDPETGLPHLTAVRFHAAALIRFQKQHPELNNIPAYG